MTREENPQCWLSVFLCHHELHASAVADDKVLISIGFFSGQDDPFFFSIQRIETQMILIQGKEEDRASDRQTKTKDGNEDIGVVAFQVSQGYLEIVFKHGWRFSVEHTKSYDNLKVRTLTSCSFFPKT